MKTMNLLTLTVVTGSLLTLSLAAQAGILNSPHDFHARPWNVDPANPATVCGVCHTPHHASTTAGPLWNHDQTTAAGFTMYANGAAPGASLKLATELTPAASSLACLSCHDGTVAINAYGSPVNPSRTPAETIATQANLTKDLTHSHPISMTYSSAQVGNGVGQDKWLFNPDTTPVLTPDSGTFVPGNDMTVNGFLLGSNHRLECNSCHDVHNQEGTPFNITSNPKLVKINGTQAGVGSLLCRSCHNK